MRLPIEWFSRFLADYGYALCVVAILAALGGCAYFIRWARRLAVGGDFGPLRKSEPRRFGEQEEGKE